MDPRVDELNLRSFHLLIRASLRAKSVARLVFLDLSEHVESALYVLADEVDSNSCSDFLVLLTLFCLSLLVILQSP